MGKWTKYIRRYCVEWESDPRLKDWLRPLPGEPTKAYCRFCRAVLRAHHSDLLVHTETRKHGRNTAIFLTSCKLKNIDDSTNNTGDGLDTHLCGKCGTRFNNLSSFIYHKVEEEGYRLFYAPSERNTSLILPNLLEDSSEVMLKNSSVFSDTHTTGKNQPEVTSVSVTVASLPESFSDDERCHIDTDEETEWEDHAADRDTNDSQETNEGTSYSDEGDKGKAIFACCFCDKLFDSLKRAQVHLGTSHQAIIYGDGELSNDLEDGDVEGDSKMTETDGEDCEDDFECSSCGAKFKKLSVLKSHQLTHSDIRIHACTYSNCTHSFKTKGSLERHIRRHTGERPYVCNLCGRKFSESGVLARHLKSQTPCIMKSDAEFPRYGKPLKMLTGNEMQTEISQLDTSSRDGLICENGMDINTNPIESLEQNIPDEDRKFTTVKQNLDINDENIVPNNESSILVLPPSPSSTSQQLENKCLACGKSFESREELKNHLIHHLSSESFHCSVCDYLAKDEMDLIEHHNKQHLHYNIDNQDDTQFPPEESIVIDKEILENGSVSTVGLSKVVEKQLAEIENISLKDTTNSVSETFTCNICKKIFKSGVYFRLHMKMHENSKMFCCTICDKSFQLKDGLRKHMTSHSKSKFMCAVCGKMYKTISHTKEHMRAHTTDRPFVCTLCDKGCKSRNGLKVHVRTHTNDYPYSCNYCECRFREKPALVRHTRTHTGEKPFSCKHCGRSFAEHGTLNRHLRAKVPCTAQRKTKKSEADAVTSILPVYEGTQPNTVDMIQEVDVANNQSTTDSFPNLSSAEGQQYIIASSDDQEILSDTPQIDITGTIPVSDFDGISARSYIIISQTDGASGAVVAEFPIENVTFVPESETGEDSALNKEI